MININLEFKDMKDLELFVKSVQFARDYFTDYAFLNGGDGYNNVVILENTIPQLFEQWKALGGEIYD